MNFTKLMYVVLSMTWTTWLLANNISVSNISLTGINKTDKYIQVKFDISWENSWRTSSAPNNWDAAWVFVKYKDKSTGLWKHAKLNNSGHIAPTGSTITSGLVDVSQSFNAATNPAVGAFIYRSADGTGTFSVSEVELRWNYGENGLTKADNSVVQEIRVYAIEMVYVPEGAFKLGSGGQAGTTSDYAGSTREAGAFKAGNTTNTPYQVSSENAITISNATGDLFGTSLNQSSPLANATILESGTSATLPAGFPKGFAAFYCMKHELNQQGLVDFLNTITVGQQSFQFEPRISASGYNVYVMANSSTPALQNGIRASSPLPASGPLTIFCDLNGNGVGGESDDGAAKPANYMQPRNMLAYLDWACLRPMTEMEYEKACRGTANPVALEFAWGSASGNVSSNDASVSNANTADETPPANTTVAFNGFVSIRNHVRTGSFAKASTNRASAGATYYGILEMSGNMYENVICVTREEGRNFEGKYHGDGELVEKATMRTFGFFNDGDEIHNTPTWPLITGIGLGARGGSVMTQRNIIRVSDRYVTKSPITGDQASVRGVRTAP